MKVDKLQKINPLKAWAVWSGKENKIRINIDELPLRYEVYKEEKGATDNCIEKYGETVRPVLILDADVVERVEEIIRAVIKALPQPIPDNNYFRDRNLTYSDGFNAYRAEIIKLLEGKR